jgi:hypothetical protein
MKKILTIQEMKNILNEIDFEQVIRENGYNEELLKIEGGAPLKMYILLTHFPELVMSIDFRIPLTNILYSRYYWLSKIARNLEKNVGTDNGISQQLFMLIEEIDSKIDEVDWSLIESIDKGTLSI